MYVLSLYTFFKNRVKQADSFFFVELSQMLCMRYLSLWRRRVHCLLAKSFVIAHSCRKEFKYGRTLKDSKHSISGCEQRNLFVVTSVDRC